MTAPTLAKKLALAILTTNGNGKAVVCRRIALKAGEYGKETDMGGLNDAALIEVLTTELVKLGFGTAHGTATTMQQEWEAYRNQVYPQGISGIQHVETHQAFYAGANVMMSVMLDVAPLPEDLALQTIGRLQNEIIEAAQTRVATVKARN